ncbi:pro-resilin-like [Cylas formicarius]|uniref:pro-resilin-like n=1 Tax=Cylas formicarius TaxID=197179 RepID=UPI002958DF2B|nr:pro-resilin-like [Cylas formicarius]
MGWIWLGIVLASLVCYTQGQQGYNYPPPQKTFDGGSTVTPNQGGEGFTPGSYSSSTTVAYESPAGGYPGNLQRPSNRKPGGHPGQNGGYTTAGYPQGPNGFNGFPSSLPTGYPAPGRPNGPSIPPTDQSDFQRPTPTSGFPGSTFTTPGYQRPGGPQGPTGGYGAPGQTLSTAGYPGSGKTSQTPFQPGGPSGGYPGNGQGYLGANDATRASNGFQRSGGSNGYGGSTEGEGRAAPRGFDGEQPSERFPSQQPTGENDEGDYSAIPGQPDIDYPILAYVPETSFRCDQQQYPGYYADVETRCQVFHICANNKTYDFLCPNGTIFHQEYLVCVWWDQFDCNSAPSLFGVNENIYDYSITGAQQTGFGGSSRSGAEGPGYPLEDTDYQQGSGPGYQPGAPSPAEGSLGYPPSRPGVAGQTIPSSGYPSGRPSNGQRPSGGYPGAPQEQLGSTQTPGGYSGNGRPQRPEYIPPSNGQRSGNGYPSDRPPTTGYPGSQTSNGGGYRNGNGGTNGQNGGGSKQPNREYLPPYQQ